MSFDVGIWSSDRRITSEEAGDIYDQLLRHNFPVLTPTPNGKASVAAFVTELTTAYPQIDDVPEEEIDSCPWNVAFDVSEAHVIISIAWSRVDEVVPYISELTHKHGLIVYDPQREVVTLPPFPENSI